MPDLAQVDTGPLHSSGDKGTSVPHKVAVRSFIKLTAHRSAFQNIRAVKVGQEWTGPWHRIHIIPSDRRRRHGKQLVIFICVHLHRQPELPKVVCALYGVRPLFTAGETWQQHAGEDRNDCNHHQEFNQSECPSVVTVPTHERYDAPSMADISGNNKYS